MPRRKKKLHILWKTASATKVNWINQWNNKKKSCHCSWTILSYWGKNPRPDMISFQRTCYPHLKQVRPRNCRVHRIEMCIMRSSALNHWEVVRQHVPQTFLLLAQLFRIFTKSVIPFFQSTFMCLCFLSWDRTSKSCSVWSRTLWTSSAWGWKTFKTCMKSLIT